MNYIQYCQTPAAPLTANNIKGGLRLVRDLVRTGSKNIGLTDAINSAGKSWKEFWDKPMTVRYAYSPYEVVGNGGKPNETTQRRGDIVKEATAAVSAPAIMAGAATTGVPATIGGLVLGAGGAYVGDKTGQGIGYMLGTDENGTELLSDGLEFVGGLYGGSKGTKYGKAYNDLGKGYEEVVAQAMSEVGRSSNPKNISFFTHSQGDDAIRMFKEYGGEKWPEGSELGSELLKYAPEARVRYGLLGNNTISDEEIAQALYKQIQSQDGLTTIGGEPILGFRGDTQRYTQLKARPTPEELLTMRGTMDNSLGNLFLQQYPHPYQQGIDRYIVTARPEPSMSNPDVWVTNVAGSGTGASPINIPETINFGDFAEQWPKFAQYPIKQVLDRRGNPLGITYKIKPEYTSTGINDLNAFMFRGQPRNATNEIQVANGGRSVTSRFNLHVNERPIKDLTDPEELTYIWKGNEINVLDDTGSETGALRELMSEHYRNLLNDTKQNGQGLLISGRVPLDAKGTHPFRDEHSRYTYLALPNFNIKGAKHILPYDLRVPRQWGENDIYFKSGGPLNYLSYFKNGGIHIKPENKGKFTATKKRTGKTTEELTHSKNPLTRKRAIFAQNAKKWNHK